MFHISKVFPSKQQTFVMSLSEFVRVVKIFDFAFISPLFTIPICSPISIALILHTVQLTHPYIHNQSQTYPRNLSFDTYIYIGHPNPITDIPHLIHFTTNI